MSLPWLHLILQSSCSVNSCIQERETTFRVPPFLLSLVTNMVQKKLTSHILHYSSELSNALLGKGPKTCSDERGIDGKFQYEGEVMVCKRKESPTHKKQQQPKWNIVHLSLPQPSELQVVRTTTSTIPSGLGWWDLVSQRDTGQHAEEDWSAAMSSAYLLSSIHSSRSFSILFALGSKTPNVHSTYILSTKVDIYFLGVSWTQLIFMISIFSCCCLLFRA